MIERKLSVPSPSGVGMTLGSLTVTLNSFQILFGKNEKVDHSPSRLK